MSIKQKFKSTIGAQKYLFKNGKAAEFVDGVFLTDDPEEIAELQLDIQKYGIPHIYQDPNDAIVDTTLQDKISAAISAARAQAIKEHEEASGGVDTVNEDALKNVAATENSTSAAAVQPNTSANPAVLLARLQGGANTGIASSATVMPVTPNSGS